MTNPDGVKLCVAGTPEQILAHSALDRIERKAELRRLTADDERVVAAAKVCHECVFVDECTEAVQSYFEGVEVALPRPISKVGVYGRALYLDADLPSLELIELEEVGVASSSLALAREALHIDSVPHFGEDIQSQTVYEYVVYGKKPEDFAGFLKELRTIITHEKKASRPKKKNQSGVEQTRLKSATHLRLNQAISVDKLPAGYSTDREQSERGDLICRFMNGNLPVSALTGNPDDDGTDVRVRIRKNNQDLISKDKAVVEKLGACKSVPDWSIRPKQHEGIEKYRAKCIGCPAFVACGVVAFLGGPAEGVRVSISERQMTFAKAKIGTSALVAAMQRPDFAEIRIAFAAHLRIFDKQVRDCRFTRVEKYPGQKSHNEVVDALAQNLASVMDAFSTTQQ